MASTAFAKFALCKTRLLEGPSDTLSSISIGCAVTPERMTQMPSTSARSEEHTSELQSLMRISYAVFCLKKKKLSLAKKRQMNTRQTDIEKKNKENMTEK